jgi:ABC-type Fe3+/spermidine/putrescine transport system ATPase subunit
MEAELGPQGKRGPQGLPANGQAELVVHGLVRRYTGEVTVGPISFTVGEGEFFSLLGPSGCGKTTTLRCIAGFEPVDAGAIELAGRRIEKVPPHKREIGLVFQTPMLFPHLTVSDNVAFGLSVHGVPRREAARRVAAMLELVGLSELGQRSPNQLSGGQQQRAALARSLVLEPPLLLLDEPFSNLDLKLRVQMREELRKLQRRLRKTTIFVTHDQTEALALSHRIAVLSAGRIEQIGTPQEIYGQPASRFVADFIGNANLLEAEVLGWREGIAEIATESGLRLLARAAAAPGIRRLTALVRPELIRIGSAAASVANAFTAEVREVVYLGDEAQYRLRLGERAELLLVRKLTGGGDTLPYASVVDVGIDPGDIVLLSR